MNLKIYEINLKFKKKLISFWYWLMKPIAYFYTTEKENKRYKKKQDRITEEQATRWIAEDIARYAVRHSNDKIHLLICEYASSDDFWHGCTLGFNNPYIKRDKTRMAYYKFRMTIEFQEKIINEIKKIRGIEVEEEIEKFTWENIRNYQKSYIISKRETK